MDYVKKNITTVVLFLLATLGTFTWNLIQKGSEVEINQKIDARIDDKIKNGGLVQVLLQSKEITKFTDEAGKNIRDQVVKNIMRKDTNKVSLRAIIGKGTKLRDEDVPDAIINVINDYNKGKLYCKRTNLIEL